MNQGSRIAVLAARGLGALLIGAGVAAAAPGQQIEGWVRLASGQAAAGMQVRLYDLSDPTRSLGVATDEAGYFSLAAPRPAGETDALPRRFELFQNHPNPFNPSTTIPYQLPAPAYVRLEVFNLLGQRVATLVDEEQQAGRHTATWNGTDAAGRPVASGLYLYRLRGSGTSDTRRMVLLDGPVAVSGAAPTPGIPARTQAPGQAYGLTVSGPGVVTHVDPDFRAGPWPVEIEARAAASDRAAKAVASGSRILGDVDANGRVDLLDAILVALYSIDPATTLPNDGDISLGDVNRDGRIDVADVYLIASYSVDPGNPSLPAGIGEPLVVVLEGKMYWVDRWTAKIQRANLDGSEVEDLVTTGLEEPTDLALDVAGGKMYWTDRLTDKIKRASLDGSQIEDLVTGIFSIWSLALDVDGGKMYWTNASWRGPRIQRANLDGSQVEDLVTTGLLQIAGLSLDVPGGKMYWTDDGAKKIQRANLDGSQVEDLVTTGLHGPWGLALDFAGGKMYWADWITDKILRANFDGSQVEELLTRPDPSSLVLVIPEGKMYWTEGAKILRANLDGSQVEELLASGLRAPRGLALDLPGLQEIGVNRPPVLDLIGKQSLEEGEILRIDLVARDPEGTEVVFEAQSDDPGIARVSLSGRRLTVSPAAPGEARVTVTARDASGVSTTQDFLVTVTEPVPESRGWMYWTDAGTDKIQRANLDGSQVEDLLTIGLDGPWGIALDVSDGKMYWVDTGTDKIQRANLDGSGVEDVITTGLAPKTLALDVSGGKMYWTDEGGVYPRPDSAGEPRRLPGRGVRFPGSVGYCPGPGCRELVLDGHGQISHREDDPGRLPVRTPRHRIEHSIGLGSGSGRGQDVLDGSRYGQDTTGQPRRHSSRRHPPCRIGGSNHRHGTRPGRRQDVLDGPRHKKNPAGQPRRDAGRGPRHRVERAHGTGPGSHGPGPGRGSPFGQSLRPGPGPGSRDPFREPARPGSRTILHLFGRDPQPG